MKTDTFTESILYKHPRDRSRSSGTCTRVRKLDEDQGVLSRKQLVTEGIRELEDARRRPQNKHQRLLGPP